MYKSEVSTLTLIHKRVFVFIFVHKSGDFLFRRVCCSLQVWRDHVCQRGVFSDSADHVTHVLRTHLCLMCNAESDLIQGAEVCNGPSVLG